MGGYKYLTTEQEEILSKFPMPDEADKAAVNALFKHYIFFEKARSGRKLWTSCCGQDGVFFDNVQRTMTHIELSIIWGEHNQQATCPFCGREVTLKNVKRLGKMKNLLEYIPVVFLKEKNGDLFAQAYWARKDYQGGLADPPLYMLSTAYHFTPGKATSYWQDGYDKWRVETLEGNYDPVHRKITEPFTKGSYMVCQYVPYTVLGMDAIKHSSFRYCQYDTFKNRYIDEPTHSDLMKYLAASCIYPQNIEMLVKGGMMSLVEDLVCGRRKNRGVIKWGEKDPRKAFGLDGQELKEFMKSKRRPEELVIYKQIRKAGFKPSFETAAEIVKELMDEKEFIKVCAKYRIKPEKALKYLHEYTGPRCYGGYFTTHNAWTMWRDYLNAAVKLEYDMTVQTVVLPRDLFISHDNATGEIQRRLEAQKSAADALAASECAQRLQSREKKYNIDLYGFIIEVAQTSEEVIAEGKALVHCVGGYAKRHMEGKTNILFMRKASEPDTPFITIEMNGDKLVQIHGYRNEAVPGAKSPAIEYAYVLEPWLEWIKAGSKRDENGKPKLKIREEKTA